MTKKSDDYGSVASSEQHKEQEIIVSQDATTTEIFVQESRLLLGLAIPTIIIQLGFTMPPFLTASYVGRTFGPTYLDGFQLANLTGNLFTLSLLQGLYSASDTLSPQAYTAGNYSELGYLAMRGFLSSMGVMLPICVPLAFLLRRFMVYFGEDVEASLHAGQWYSIYVLALPIYAAYMVTWKFLSAQNIMTPLVVGCLISVFVVLPVTLKLYVDWFGYRGSAMAVVTYQVSQLAIIWLYLKILHPHHPQSWTSLGSAWKHALEWEPLKVYLNLGLGGIVASSEWIYWETLSLAIGKLGIIPLSVHTVPTQMLTVGFMLPMGIGIGLAVRLGAIIPHNVSRARSLVMITFLLSVLVFGILACWMYTHRTLIVKFFTDDPDVMSGTARIWHLVCIYYHQIAIFSVNLGIATGLGMQWTLGCVTVVSLWMIGLPTAWYYGVTVAQDLKVVWNWIVPPHILINVILLIAFIRRDWNEISQAIRKREKMDVIKATDDADAFEENTESQNLLSH